MKKTDIEKAYKTISPHIINTPIIFSHTLSDLTGCRTYFKLENFQMTGSFKERGALNRLMHLTKEECRHGIATASAGNHAQGVAMQAQRMGINAKIVMPVNTPLIKVTSTENYRAEVVLHGKTYHEAEEYAKSMASEEGRAFIHPFDDDLVIAGQGTIGKEIMDHETGSTIDAVVCPIGGGGLISGIATYIKETRPEVKIIGVEAETFSSMKASLEAGRVTPVEGAGSLADGIAVKSVCTRTFDLVKRYVDDVLLVNEDEIANAIMLLLEIEKIVVEGAAATVLAALLNRKHGLGRLNVLSILSGGNIDVNMLSRIIDRGLAVDGRIARIRLSLRDYPGSLAETLQVIKNLNANVLNVEHQRMASTASIGYVDVTLYLETRGPEHIQKIKQALGKCMKDEG